jgi:cyclohexadieny/prephenate dehydrogenase
MFSQITIIGFGLIGSSVARAVKQGHLADKIICADASEEVCGKALSLDIADEATTDFAASVKDSDFVLLCVPVGAMPSVAKQIAPHLKEGALVSDVGSVKTEVMQKLSKILPDTVDFIPGHPIAGTEKSGPEHGFAELFQNRWFILTPDKNADILAVDKLTKFWEALGSNIQLMDAEHHDLVLGITSHLPHLIAYTIVGTATDLEEDLKSEVIKFSAGGFRDFTRIAASNPEMWRDVFLNNKAAVLEVLQRFTEDLTALQRAIRKGDGDYLYDTFTSTRAIRQAIVEAGQATYVYPKESAEGVPPVAAPKTGSDR